MISAILSLLLLGDHRYVWVERKQVGKAPQGILQLSLRQSLPQKDHEEEALGKGVEQEEEVVWVYRLSPLSALDPFWNLQVLQVISYNLIFPGIRTGISTLFSQSTGVVVLSSRSSRREKLETHGSHRNRLFFRV